MFTFRVWDFAGQEDYYATHQCFLSERSLYLLIWDLTDGEKGILGLKPWLDNLATRVPGSTIIIVGTKLDLIRPENQKTFEDWIQQKIDEVIDSERRYCKINVHSIINVTSITTHRDYKISKFIAIQ